MPGPAQDGSVPTHPALGIDQFGRIQERLAGIALISAGSCGTALRTDSLDEPVCKESLVMFTVELLDLRFPDISRCIDLPEDILDDLGLHRTAGAAEMIEIDLEPSVDIPVDRMIPVAQRTRLHAFLESPRLTCRPILVGTANVERLIAFQTAETGKTIG